MASLAKNIHVTAAKLAADDPLMKSTAERVQAIAKGVATQHRDSGEFAASIKLERGGGRVKDWIVYSDDPNAWSKEFGHTTPKGRFVDGVHAFGKALGEGGRGLVR